MIFISIFPEYTVSDGNILESVPRISKPALQKAGGMKTTTFSVLILNAIATFRSQENAGAFGRRLEYHVIKNAATIAMLYFALFFGGGIAISVYEGLPLLDCLYEAASAVGTVGLTLGITPELHVPAD